MPWYEDDKFGSVLSVRHGASIGGARERMLLDELGGAESFRTRIGHNPDGSKTILKTKDGMPEFVTSKSYGKCPFETGPIIESNYSGRTFWAEDDPRFSYDGLYSVGIKQTKNIEVSLPNGVYESSSFISLANPVFTGKSSELVTRSDGELIAASVVPAYPPSKTAFVEAMGDRTYQAKTGKYFVTNAKGAFVYLSDYAVKSISFLRETCARRLLRLTYSGSKLSGSAHGSLVGDYVVDSISRPAGPTKEINHARTDSDELLRLEFGEADLTKGGFLEEIHPLDVAGMGGYSSYEPDGITQITWPVLSNWGSPLRGFSHVSGVFTDETRSDLLDVAFTPEPQPDVASGSWSIPLEPKYYNFNPPGTPDLAIHGATLAKIKPDATFNTKMLDGSLGYLHSAPGMPATELRSDEHLYKDPDGMVWVVRVTIDQQVSATTDRINFWLHRRFDPVYRENPIINRLLIGFIVSNEGNDPYDQPGDAMYLSAYYVVSSLPNGEECSVTLYHPVTTTAIAIATFSGVGGVDGGGVSATAEQVPTWISSTGTIEPNAATIVEDTQSKIFTANDGSGIVFDEYDFSRDDYGRTLHSQWASTQPSGTTCGPFTSVYSRRNVQTFHSKDFRAKKRRIRMLPTKDNAWEPIVLDWALNTEYWGNLSSTQFAQVDTTSYLNMQTSPSNSISGTADYFERSLINRHSHITYTWGSYVSHLYIDLDYGYERSSSAPLEYNPGYGTAGFGLHGNTHFATVAPTETSHDTLNTNALSGSPLAPYPYQHSHRCECIETVAPYYTGEITITVGSETQRVGISQLSMFAGLTFSSTWVNNAGTASRVCHDPRNERLWVAPTAADSGAFY